MLHRRLCVRTRWTQRIPLAGATKGPLPYLAFLRP
jgi:hypothetical protein